MLIQMNEIGAANPKSLLSPIQINTSTILANFSKDIYVQKNPENIENFVIALLVWAAEFTSGIRNYILVGF
jgi:hypothetical protein